MKKLVHVVSLSIILSLPTITQAQVPGVIGVKFGFTAGSGYATPDDLAPTDAAGILVDGVEAVSNWNNLLLTAAPSTPYPSANMNLSWSIAQDSAGNALSGVTLTPAGLNDGWYSGGTECANGRLLYDCWKWNSGHSAGAGTTGGDPYFTFTFSNLPASEYDVYLYINDNNGNYWGNAKANSVMAVGTSLTGQGFNGGEADPCGNNPQLFTYPNYHEPVNYEPMPAVSTTAGGVITIEVVAQGGGDFGVPGIELVPTGTIIETGPPIPAAPAVSPSLASTGLAVGTPVSLTASASGAPPVSYQWQTDGGSGNTPTNIPGATSTNLALNTTGWAPGTYVYDYVAANALATNTSSEADITLLATSPTPAISVQFEGNGSSSILNRSLVAGYVPQKNWNVDDLSSGGTASSLVDYTGTATAATVQVSYGNGQYFSSDNINTSDGIMMSGGFWSGDGYTINVTGVPYSSYNVYLYMLNDNNPNRRYGFILGSQTNWGAVFNGNGYSVPPYTLDTQTAELPEGSQMQANLVEFHGITGGSFLITGLTPDGNVALMGMQIVNPAAGPAVANPISITPAQGSIYQGETVLLSEFALGAAPLFYQWMTDGGLGGPLSAISGATNSTLAVNTATFSPGNYNYQVIVTNATGDSTSAVVTLTITASGPVLLTDISPAPAVEFYVGRTFSYTATFGGSLPMTLQWLLDTGNGSGPQPISSSSNPTATNSTLVLADVQLANAGTYSLTASNALGGPVSSSSSSLTVLADPASAAANSYAALILSEDPVAYWRFNETNDPSTGILPVYDYSPNQLDGVYGNNCVNGFDSIDGPQPPAFPGFETNNFAMASQNGINNSWVTVPPLDLSTNTAATTITMWIYPTATSPSFGGLFYNRPYGAGLGFGGTANSSGMYELGYTWNNNAGNTWGFNSGLYPLQDQWSFVALVVQSNQAAIYLYYIDPNTGQPDLYSAVNQIAHVAAPFNTVSTIGTDDNSPTSVEQRTFSGSIDEVAVFQTAFTSGQILQLFSEGAGLGELPPTITGQPQSDVLFAGGTANFAASGITGSAPLSYQWQYDGANIIGATNPSLTISNVSSTNAGSYQLFVTNPLTTTNSSVATLTVVTPTANSYDAAVLADDPLVYYKLTETNNPANGGVEAFDYVNGYNGIYQINAENGYNGVLGPESPLFAGFPATNTALENVADIPNSYVTASVGSMVAGNLTYAMWIYPMANVQNSAGLLFDRGGAGAGFCFGVSANASGMSELGYTWNQNNADTYDWDSSLFPPLNEWSLVAMTIAPTQATLYLINSNGVQSAANVIPHDTEAFGLAWHIGDDSAVGNNGDRTFPGSISDVSVYLSTLSSNQIVSLYNAGLEIAPSVTLTISPVTAGNVTLTWSQGTLLQATNLAGPWTTNASASPATIAATNSLMFFKVLVP